MKNRFFLPGVVAIALFTISSQCKKDKVDTEKSNLTALQITLDHTAWFCAENCRYNFLFEEESVTTRRYNKPYDEDPLWVCTRPLSDQEWQAIVEAVDPDALSKTEATIGCPGCADEMIETLKVTAGDFSHEVRMNTGTEVPAIQNLLDELRSQAENHKTQENCQ